MSRSKSASQCGLTLALLLSVAISAQLLLASNIQVIANNTPQIPANARNLGPENINKNMTVTLWLKQHNEAEFDRLVQSMYQKGSVNYHKWLTKEQYAARFAPTAQEAVAVRDYLSAHGLKIASVDKSNHFVVAQGRVADVQNAFHVQINRFSVNGETRRANLSDPMMDSAAGALVSSIQGLSDHVYMPHAVRPVDPDTGKAWRGIPLASVGGSNGLFFSGNCLRSPQTHTFKTNGGNPRATYTGNRFGSDITSDVPNLPPCGYSPSEVRSAYGLKALYKAGWTGKGQTIVIVDAFGSPTIRQDANTFSTLYGLPRLTTSNFQIIRVGVATGCTPADGCNPASWVDEVTLDVEWAHAVAPEANILLIATKDNTFTNLDLGVFLAASNQLGSVISNSYGAPEILIPASELKVQNSNNKLAASLGSSAQYSTGDDGDFGPASGGAFTSASAPATSPFATAVGGTSMFLNSAKTAIKLQTGWGNNETRIADVTPNPPVIPPLSLGFVFGAGGGASGFFGKPAYQSSLPGSKRQTPDIGYLADPFTGVELIVTDKTAGGQVVGVIGGTSLACPMFSALWAIANQAAGKPLGLAARMLYHLPADAITDVIDETSAANVHGTIYAPPKAPETVTADELAEPLENTVHYVSAMYNSPFSTRWFTLTFGTDTSLTTGPGWDNVTGLGTPNGLKFVQAVVAASH